MAKNLKLNIKNTQLAEALRLNRVKKPSAAKPKKTTEPVPAAQEVVEAPPSTPPSELAKEKELDVQTAQATWRPKREGIPPRGALQKEAVVRAPLQEAAPPPEATPAATTTPPSEAPPLAAERSTPTYPEKKLREPLDSTASLSKPPLRGPAPKRPLSAPPGAGPKTTSRFASPFSSLTPSPRPSRPDTLRTGPSPAKVEEGRTLSTTTRPGLTSGDYLTESRKIPVREFRDIKTVKRAPSRTFDSRDRQGLRDSESEQWRKRRPSHKPRMQKQEEVIRPKELAVRIPITIKDLAAAMKLKASELVAKLFMKGVTLTLNDYLDDETTVQLLGHDFDCEITIDTSEEQRLRITDKTIKQEIADTLADSLQLRPPVIAFMGHVDHGKTSLIDAIRKTNRAALEAGAITQHIGAFCCHTAVGNITILDTPGHEAFSSMRERGADVTDIVVLVVAGDEGIRAQTLEAIQQSKSANVPILVAINKSDKPGFNAENIYRQLSENELLPETWGGTTITINCSAVTGDGITALLEMLALQAEVLELRANPVTRARGAVIESEMHKGLGAQATVLIQNGTLRTGDAIVFDQHWGRVKTMHDEYGKELSLAGPSTPVKITGLSGLPEAGSEFIVVGSEREARQLGEGRTLGQRNLLMQQTKKIGVENLLQQKADAVERKTLNLILRADVQGSLEALKTSLLKIDSKKITLNILSSAVGEISESDIQLAAASKAVVIGFHTQVERHADTLIKENKVVVKLHDIIYHAVDDVRAIMVSLLDKIIQENDTGSALVKAIFKSSQLGLIAGCQVVQGSIRRNQHVRVIRDEEQIWKGPIASLKRVKEDVREATKGMECGILLQNFSDVKEGDILQAFDVSYLEQEL